MITSYIIQLICVYICYGRTLFECIENCSVMMMLMINLSSEFISNIYASDSRVRCQPVTMFIWPFVRTDRDRSRYGCSVFAMGSL